MTTSQLLFGVLFSSIGLGYFMYGKKQKVIVPFFCELVLMIYSYFKQSTGLLVLIGSLFSVLPYFVRL